MGDGFVGINLETAVLPAFESMVNNVLGLMTALIPIGLSVFAVMYGVRKAKGFLKNV